MPLPRKVLRRFRLLIRPDTVLRWHRDLIKRRHARTCRPKRPGRPPTVRSIRMLILRLVRENPSWGYRRVHGELTTLGIQIAASTVWEILTLEGIDPAPDRTATTWSDFLATRTSNRIRGLLTQFHPSLERVLGPRLDHHAVTWLLERYGSPAALRKAGRRRLVDVIRPKAPRMAQRLIDEVFDALDEQTVIVPGTGTLDIVVPSLTRSLAAVHDQRRALEAQINTLLEDHPLMQCGADTSGPSDR